MSRLSELAEGVDRSNETSAEELKAGQLLELTSDPALLAQADVFIAVGTSGQVYPAANFVAMAADSGARTIEINLEPSQQNSLFEEKIVGQAGKTLPEFVARFIQDYC